MRQYTIAKSRPSLSSLSLLNQPPSKLKEMQRLEFPLAQFKPKEIINNFNDHFFINVIEKQSDK